MLPKALTSHLKSSFQNLETMRDRQELDKNQLIPRCEVSQGGLSKEEKASTILVKMNLKAFVTIAVILIADCVR